MKVLHIMGMRSTKFGGLEKFMLSLKDADNTIEHTLVYKEAPQDFEYVKKN